MPATNFKLTTPSPSAGVPEYTPEDLNHVIFNPHQEAGEEPKFHAAERSRLAHWFKISPEIETSAEVAWPVGSKQEAEQKEQQAILRKTQKISKHDESMGIYIEEKTKFDRALDWCVEKSGSVPVFVVTQSLLWAWAFMGTKYHKDDWWQVVISDAQAIYSYALDSVILHQQLIDLDESRYINGQLASRNMSKLRMMTQLQRKYPKVLLGEEDAQSGDKVTMQATPMLTGNADGILEINGESIITELPKEKGFAKVIRNVSLVFGHLGAVAVFWVGFVIWLSNGPHHDWSDEWQLYYNSACSAFMVFEFSLLCVTTETFARYRRACIGAIKALDRAIERELRTLTHDEQPNPTVLLKLSKSTKLQSWIETYAYIVGTLIGLVVLVVVIIVWICIGPLMKFNGNWWLIIGTYAGLIGLHDSFVLRFMQKRIGIWTSPWLEAVRRGDEELTRMVNPSLIEQDKLDDQAEIDALAQAPFHVRWTNAASKWILAVCAHELTVVAELIAILGMICGSTALLWSVTGQLICNNPPGVLESFLMQILITGLNAADAQEQKQTRRMYERRLALLTRLTSQRGLLEEFSGADDDKDSQDKAGVSGDEIEVVPKLARTAHGDDQM